MYVCCQPSRLRWLYCRASARRPICLRPCIRLLRHRRRQSFSWTGFYLGGNIGAAQVRRDWTDITRGVPFTQGSGANFMAGGQIGYNWQINNFVLGVEADGDWLSRNNNNGAGIIVPGIAGPIAVTSNSTFLTTVAARFGFAVNRALIYGKAGGGWVGQSNVTVTNLDDRRFDHWNQ